MEHVDVTQLHQAQHAEASLDLLVREAPVGIAMVSIDLRFRRVNPAFCRLLGYEEAELLQLDLLDVTHPDDREEERARSTAGAAGRTTTETVLKRFVRRDGSTVLATVTGHVVRDEDGVPIVLIGFAQEWTELARIELALRESQDRFQAVFELLLDGILLFDDEGLVVQANPAMAALTGLEIDALEGAPLFAWLDDEARGRAAFQQLLAEGSLAGTSVIRRGEERLTCEFVARADALPGIHLAAVRDVTERTLLEERLRHVEKLEALGRLAGGVAHDFSNILTGIRGYASFLVEALEPDDPRRADALEIHDATERAAALTRQLLAFSRRQVLAPRELDLNALVARVAPMLRRTLGEEVELELELGGGLDPVSADASQLEQVVVNLALNARDALDGPGRSAISTRAAALDGRPHLALAVADEGVGIDAATRERMFEPFFSTKPPGHGVGLGLSAVLGVVEQSGGKVEVVSEPGHGTTVTVLLPTLRPRHRVAPTGPANGLPLGGTVLVAHREADLRRRLGKAFSAAGATVLEAETPERALEVVASYGGRLDLLVLDAAAAVRDPDVGERLAERCPDVRVLLVAAAGGRVPADGALPLLVDPEPGDAVEVARTLLRERAPGTA
ncbi:MAG: PAS domain S-box protein [Thermoleophilia bacterium]